MLRALGLFVVVGLTTVAGVVLGPSLPTRTAPVAPDPVLSPAQLPSAPLTGVRIALDPGHQLGNRNFGSRINAPVPAGGFEKPCNTTGTATNAGLPEATLTWEVADLVRRQLVDLGAAVLLTRARNSDGLWGPCVNQRGAFGGRHRADLTVSLHADGAPASALGFHVIVPGVLPGFTDDIARPSRRLGLALRSGLSKVPRSTYVTDALSVRTDLGTLNMSDVPIAMVELGNMRNASDAARMSSAAGRRLYASGIVAGIRAYLAR